MPTSSGLAPTVSATGIRAGTFAQWQAFLIAQYQAIFGADSYLGNDSQDGEFIGVIAQALADVCASAVGVYNSFSPTSAQGAGLASVVKINGLKKLIPSYSTTPGTVVGVANTVINNGQVKDANGLLWNLPPSVTIPSSGTISVTLTCSQQGAVLAAANTITRIQTPQFGWQSITNPAAAAVGAPVEMDAALRVRQSQSVALPSQTIFAGIVAGIRAVAGVTRAQGYENNTGSTNSNGIPANTLYFVVEGGASGDIFSAIVARIPPGIPTMGGVSETYTDAAGSTRLLKYDVSTPATITAAITVKALAGWSSASIPLIQQAVVNYLEALAIGGNVSYLQGVVPAATLPAPVGPTYNITAVTLQKNAGSAASADIQLNFNESAVAALTNVTVAVT